MKDNLKSEQSDGQRFYGQWTKFKRPSWAMTFHKPTCTIPDQSMTIQEIIAKYTRTGLVPQSFARRDDGGNEAFDPDFDPMDEGTQYLEAAMAEQAAAEASAVNAQQAAAAAAAPGSEQAPAGPGSEPEKPREGEGAN